MPSPSPVLTAPDVRAALRLPGFDAEAAREALRPPRRGPPPPGSESVPPRPAAALAYVFPRSGRLLLPLTVRPAHLREHAGQVSLPGGRPAPGEDLWATALREAREEVGLDAREAERVGDLAPLYIPVSHSHLTVCVALGPDPGELRPEPAEVERIVLPALDDLLDPACRGTRRREVAGVEVDVPFLDLCGLFVWGATAMALAEFGARLAAARAVPRAGG